MPVKYADEITGSGQWMRPEVAMPKNEVQPVRVTRNCGVLLDLFLKGSGTVIGGCAAGGVLGALASPLGALLGGIAGLMVGAGLFIYDVRESRRT